MCLDALWRTIVDIYSYVTLIRISASTGIDYHCPLVPEAAELGRQDLNSACCLQSREPMKVNQFENGPGGVPTALGLSSLSQTAKKATRMTAAMMPTPRIRGMVSWDSIFLQCDVVGRAGNERLASRDAGRSFSLPTTTDNRGNLSASLKEWCGSGRVALPVPPQATRLRAQRRL